MGGQSLCRHRRQRVPPGHRLPGVKLAVEIDGLAYHSSRAAFERDRFRQNVLVRAGWTVLRFTLQQLEYDPEGVVAVVRTVLQQLERRQRSGRQRPADAG